MVLSPGDGGVEIYLRRPLSCASDIRFTFSSSLVVFVAGAAQHALWIFRTSWIVMWRS